MNSYDRNKFFYKRLYLRRLRHAAWMPVMIAIAHSGRLLFSWQARQARP